MKTRGKNSTKGSAKSPSIPPNITLEPDPNPPKIVILPKETSDEARFVNLANPRSSLQTRAPKSLPRSFLLSPLEPCEELERNENAPGRELDVEYDASSGYVTKAAEIFITTPIDPLFLVLPALAPPPSKSSEPIKRHFLSCEDYLDSLILASPHFKTLLRIESTRRSVEARIAVVCDTVIVGDETMYRLNEEKLLQELLHKAEKIATAGLPASMEEKFVRKALEAPVLCIRSEEHSADKLTEEGETSDLTGTSTPATDSLDSQMTVSSTTTTRTSTSSFSDCDSPKTIVEKEAASHPIDAPEGVAHLLRLRTALAFIATSYLPPHLQASLDTLLTSLSTVSSVTVPDFAPLTTHLAHLTQLREQQLAMRSLIDLPRKRMLDEDADMQAEAKRRKDEEELRKKSESRGVRDLKKVNVRGMKKMSEFFRKK